MATLTARLKQTCKDDVAPSTSPMVYLHQTHPESRGEEEDGYQIITRAQCWDIVDRHKEWLAEKLSQTLMECCQNNQTKVQDVIVAYLSDNSPDLLMNLLGCIDLTEECIENTNCSALPAMMNVRWTPLEIARVLSPKNGSDGVGKVDSTDDTTSISTLQMYVTILIYGDGYEKAAIEAIDFMNNRIGVTGTISVSGDSDMHETKRHNHRAIALPLPNLNQKCNFQLISSQKPSLESKVSDKDAIILFTSGTSSAFGIPKGVRLSHQSLFVQSLAKTQPPCCYDEETVVAANTVPLFHIGGLSSLLAVILGGGSLVFPSYIPDSKSKGFRPETVLGSLELGRTSSAGLAGVNTLVVVPAMLHSMYEHIEKDSGDHGVPRSYPSVRLILCGGQSIGNGRLYLKTRQYFPNARIVQTYACTEAGSSITFEDLGYGNRAITDEAGFIDGATCVGLPPSHIQVGIFEPWQQPKKTERQVLPHGKMGIIGTGGPHVMLGYWTRGVAPKQTLYNEWMFTNDLGYIHPKSGKLYFCGRANDVIRTGGESVLAAEVERVLEMHPEIMECAVFGLPDEKFGEAICAAVVFKARVSEHGFNPLESDEVKDKLRQHCAKQQLAGFKRPRRAFCMQSLPRNSSGKVLKRQISRLCAQQSNAVRSRL